MDINGHQKTFEEHLLTPWPNILRLFYHLLLPLRRPYRMFQHSIMALSLTRPGIVFQDLPAPFPLPVATWILYPDDIPITVPQLIQGSFFDNLL